MRTSRAREPGRGIRYGLRRTRWDMALGGALVVFLLVVGISIGRPEFLMAVATVIFVITLSESTSRLLSYVILHEDHVDISKKPWFAKTAADRWKIPYEQIRSVALNDQTAEVTIEYRGEGPTQTRWRLKDKSIEDRSVTFRLASSATAREVKEEVDAARALASQMGLGSGR